ncbi:MAG: M15 family metallopeptidase [Clostridia bacterium]|nr:M15 family metallopeptidase [Clostridia bacterium]
MKRMIGLAACLVMVCLTACTANESAAQGTPASDSPSAVSAISEEASDASLTSDVSEAESADASEDESETESTAAPTVPTTEAPTAAPTAPPTAAPTTRATTVPPADSRAVTSKGYEIVTRGGITYVDGVLVANKTYSLPASYNPGSLTDACYDAFLTMQRAAAAEGLNLYISSGFRSYDTQDVIYNRYVANDGRTNADRYSARPGHSEHQTGLAIDLNGVLDSFGNTAEGKWVAAHAHEYGFILRYPKEKEAQTGYMYEPWHIRYIGTADSVQVATAIFESGLCLEEYYGITSAYT